MIDEERISSDVLVDEIVKTLFNKYFDYSEIEVIDTLVRHIVESRDETKIAIREAAKNDENEIARIFRAVGVFAYNGNEEGEDRGAWQKFAEYSHEEASDIELNLSLADFFFNHCLLSLRDGDMDEVFHLLGDAHTHHGGALGLRAGAEQASLQGELKRKMIYDCIASVRHAENRDQKKQALRYYKDNYTSFTSKDDAAFKIAENIVSAKFATVRGWLKGVNPE